jgi:xanthine/CO dehydrogenase XdhC/CoxF family maturation factor
MAVFADEVMGTIGGGHLEWQAIAQARQLLAQWDADPAALREHIQRYALGPSLGHAAAVRWSCTLHGLTPAMPNVCGP